MTGSAYHRIGRLATHPMFRRGQLVCPFCAEAFDRAPGAEKHLLAHDPSEDIGWRYLSSRTWEKVRGARGWATTDELLAAGRE